jgi:predicted transcriptional regulator
MATNTIEAAAAPAQGETSEKEILRMVADIVSAFVGNNEVPSAEIGGVIRTVHKALVSVGQAAPEPASEPLTPVVPIRKSVTPDYIICLEDGKKLKMLKRHLRTAYNMTPEEYRAKWNLPPDYPMVAPNYAAQRSDFARRIGLGRKANVAAPRRGRGRAQRARAEV